MNYIICTVLLFYCMFSFSAALERESCSKSAIQLTSQEIGQVVKSVRLCIICQDPLYDREKIVVQLPCSRKHALHYLCVATWKSKQQLGTCPLCRAEISEPFGDSETIRKLIEQGERQKREIKNLEESKIFIKIALREKEEKIAWAEGQREVYAAQYMLSLEKIKKLENELAGTRQPQNHGEKRGSSHCPEAGKKKRKKSRYVY